KNVILSSVIGIIMMSMSCWEPAETGPPGPGAPGARFLILLDQSPSMNDDVGWAAGRSKWEEARDEIEYFIGRLAGTNHAVGLDAYPDGDLPYLERCHDDCCADPACLANNIVRCANLAITCGRGCSVDLAPIVPPADAEASGTGIADYLELAWLPCTFGSTPLVKQLQYYDRDLSAVMPDFYVHDGKSYLIIIADSGDTCEDPDFPDAPAVVAALSAAAAGLYGDYGIRCVVIAFLGPGAAGAAGLNAIAANGGTKFTTFFPVTESGALRTALEEILIEAN
ncbi:MAG: hypothetical protein JXD23_14700, partial [Spirochaetales bacterium]|nr:hypothetical protein [Spirochaetales bacterium]